MSKGDWIVYRVGQQTFPPTDKPWYIIKGVMKNMKYYTTITEHVFATCAEAEKKVKELEAQDDSTR